MAQPGFGVSFLPGGDASYTKPRPEATQPLQEAIKVLSLRVPRVVGASPLAPLALLQGQGGGGMPSGLLETLLRNLAQPAGGPPVAAMPTPSQATGPMPAPMPQVPMPTPPAAPGIATPPMLPRPAVGPSFSGAPSPMSAPEPMGPEPMRTMPMVNITAGAKEESPPTTYTPPPQPELPNPSMAGPDNGARALFELARRLRERLA